MPAAMASWVTGGNARSKYRRMGATANITAKHPAMAATSAALIGVNGRARRVRTHSPRVTNTIVVTVRHSTSGRLAP